MLSRSYVKIHNLGKNLKIVISARVEIVNLHMFLMDTLYVSEMTSTWLMMSFDIILRLKAPSGLKMLGQYLKSLSLKQSVHFVLRDFFFLLSNVLNWL